MLVIFGLLKKRQQTCGYAADHLKMRGILYYRPVAVRQLKTQAVA